jgi:5'-nucleotidase
LATINRRALSQAYRSHSGGKPYWETSLLFAPDIIRRVVAGGARRDVLINVNFPDCRPEKVKRIAVAAHWRRRQERSRIDVRQDGCGSPYYRIAYTPGAMKAPVGTDLAVLDEGSIAITPLNIDMTDKPCVAQLARLGVDRCRQEAQPHLRGK